MLSRIPVVYKFPAASLQVGIIRWTAIHGRGMFVIIDALALRQGLIEGLPLPFAKLRLGQTYSIKGILKTSYHQHVLLYQRYLQESGCAMETRQLLFY